MNKYYHDGVEYLAIDRKAQLGDKVVITANTGKLDVGHIGEVTYMFDGSLPIVDGNTFIFGHQYRVLVPSEEQPDISESEAKALEILANLARRVHSLEQQLSATQGNVEKLGAELARARHDTKLIEGELDALKKVGVRPW
jgi:hypothetical protein